jgi:ribose 5-phosphate isomerase B
MAVGYALVLDLARAFLDAHFSGEERFQRRLAKVAALERNKSEEPH